MAASSAIDSVAVSEPAAAGLNFTDSVQLAPIASEAPQVVDFSKELASLAVTAIAPV